MESTENKLMCYVFFEIFHMIFFHFKHKKQRKGKKRYFSSSHVRM